MGSKIRKYVASSISDVDIPEVYELTRKLNRPFVESRQIEQFFPYVERHLDINFLFELPESDYIVRFEDGEDSEFIIHSPMQIPKTYPRFFTLALPEIDSEDFRSTKTIIFDLGREHIFLLPEKLSKDNHQVTETIINRLNKKYFNLTISNIELWSSSGEPQNIEIKFLQPETIELASFKIPRIEKIKMLNTSELLNAAVTFISDMDQYFDFLKIPGGSAINNLCLTNDFVMYDYSNLDITTPSIYSVKLQELSTNLFQNTEIKTIDVTSRDISKILEPVYELSEELKNEILLNLPSFQKVGAKFLYTSEFALLYDQFELDKALQATMALKMLLRTRAVKKILILTSPERENITNYYGKEILTGNWQSCLSLYLPDFAFNFYTNYNNFVSEKNYQSIITGATYEVFAKALKHRKLNYDYLSRFDLVILDDISPKMFKEKYFETLCKNLDANYIWFLTDFEDAKILENIRIYQPDKILKVLGREKSVMQKFSRIDYDYFLPLSASEKKACEGNFTIGQEQLDDVIGLGNILRFRPNVFKIFQDEQKLLNFDESNEKSEKTDLLLYHIKRIFNYENRILVYTQYEEKGINQISKLLKEAKVEFLTFQISDSNSQIKTKLEKGHNHDGNLVYLTNLKPNTIKFKFPGATQLINYDNWWNPITRWALEDKLDITDSPVTVYNYYYENTIESTVEYEMNKRGLKEKSLIELLPAEKIYSIFDESDWCDIFEMQTTLFQKQISSDPIIDNMKKLVENTRILFLKIGFTEIETSANVRDYSFNVIANSKRGKVQAKCFYTEHLSSDFLNGIIKNVRKDDNFNHIFIITNGTVSRTNIVLPENISLIDGERFKQYYHVINAG